MSADFAKTAQLQEETSHTAEKAKVYAIVVKNPEKGLDFKIADQVKSAEVHVNACFGCRRLRVTTKDKAAAEGVLAKLREWGYADPTPSVVHPGAASA